jgi:hypothetical protein
LTSSFDAYAERCAELTAHLSTSGAPHDLHHRSLQHPLLQDPERHGRNGENRPHGTHPVGTINDFPERIVTDVEFVSELACTAFAATARQTLVQVFGSTDQSDSAFISEYARGLLQAAEQSLLQQIQDNPPQPGE